MLKALNDYMMSLFTQTKPIHLFVQHLLQIGGSKASKQKCKDNYDLGQKL